MAVLLFLLALFLSLFGHSSASYCLCKDGAQDPTAYQRVIDYACGAGADCKAIQQNGPCYVSNNPKAICDYAVNSYWQNKGQTAEACVFSGAATLCLLDVPSLQVEAPLLVVLALLAVLVLLVASQAQLQEACQPVPPEQVALAYLHLPGWVPPVALLT